MASGGSNSSRLNSASRVFFGVHFFFTTAAERAIGRDVYAKFWYSSFDCNTQLKSTALSDGDIISVVDDECFRCENIFKPSGIGKKPAKYTSSSFQNVMKCDVDIRVNLYILAMLPGGTTMFQRGFKEHDKRN